MMYRFIIDPGHGWLEVPEAEVRAVGSWVSQYSYREGSFLYLEEDRDAPDFCRRKFGRATPPQGSLQEAEVGEPGVPNPRTMRRVGSAWV